jgi:hypothetical protein
MGFRIVPGAWRRQSYRLTAVFSGAVPRRGGSPSLFASPLEAGPEDDNVRGLASVKHVR